jgi:hypothetical protein
MLCLLRFSICKTLLPCCYIIIYQLHSFNACTLMPYNQTAMKSDAIAVDKPVGRESSWIHTCTQLYPASSLVYMYKHLAAYHTCLCPLVFSVAKVMQPPFTTTKTRQGVFNAMFVGVLTQNHAQHKLHGPCDTTVSLHWTLSMQD